MTDIGQIDLSGIPDAPSDIDLADIPDAKPEEPY